MTSALLAGCGTEHAEPGPLLGAAQDLRELGYLREAQDALREIDWRACSTKQRGEIAAELIALIEKPGGVPWNPARARLEELWGELDPADPTGTAAARSRVYWCTGEYELVEELASSPDLEAARAMAALDRVGIDEALKQAVLKFESFEAVGGGIRYRRRFDEFHEEDICDDLRISLPVAPQSFRLRFRLDPVRQCWGPHVYVGIIEADRDPPKVDTAHGDGTSLTFCLNSGGRTLRTSDVGLRTELVGAGSRGGLEIRFERQQGEDQPKLDYARLDLRNRSREYDVDLQFLGPTRTVRAFVSERARGSDDEWEDLWRFEKGVDQSLPDRSQLLIAVHKYRDPDPAMDYGVHEFLITDLELWLPPSEVP